MPKKSVEQYTCERCGKTWYEDGEVPVAKLTVRMELSSGTVIQDSYDVLCRGCEKTAKNYADGLVKKMTKKSPTGRKSKSGAKEGGATTPPSGPTTGTAEAALPKEAAQRPHPSDGSAHRSR